MPQSLEICLYDEVSVWSTRDIVQRLQSAPDAPVTLRINSPGGDVQEGFALANALRTHRGRKVAVVEGVCASAATFPLCACDEVQMHPESLLMVHQPWGGAGGTADEIESYAEVLRKMEHLMVGMYMRKTGKDEQAIRTLMSAETWMTPAEAMAAGFCDAILDSSPVSARASARRYAARLKLPTKSGAASSPAKNKRNTMDEKLIAKLAKHGLAEDGGNLPEALAAYMAETEDGPEERKEMAKAVAAELKAKAEGDEVEHDEPDGDEGDKDKAGAKKAMSRVASAMARQLAEADAERKALAKQVHALEAERAEREVGEVILDAKARGLTEADAREFYKDFGKAGALKWLAKFPKKVSTMGKWNLGGGELPAEGSTVETRGGVSVIGHGLTKMARQILAKGEAKDIAEAQRIAAKRAPHLYAQG